MLEIIASVFLSLLVAVFAVGAVSVSVNFREQKEAKDD